MGEQATIRVEAVGYASAPPDIARVRLFTFAEDPEPGDALTSCSLLTERVLAALAAAGVASSDLETTSIDLNEQHRRDGEVTSRTYRASSNLVATVKPPGDAGRAVAAAVEAAGTGIGINDVSFDISDRTPLVSLARRDAVVQAIRAAGELAAAAGVHLGALLELAEGTGQRPLPPGMSFRRGLARPLAGAMPAAPPPVELGELTVAVAVAALFEVAGAVAG